MNLTPTQQRIFDLLKEADGEFVSTAQIYDALYADRERKPGRSVIKVIISQMREKLDDYSILSANWHGYMLKERTK